jgi:hypothetical protein
MAVRSALFGAVCSIAISISSRGYNPARLSDGMTIPGLALEVPRSVDQIYEVIGKPGETSDAARASRKAALYSQLLDGPLIVAYFVLFGSAGLLQWRTMGRLWGWIGLIAAILVFAAAVCDVMEDIGIGRAVQKVMAEHGLEMADATAIAQFGWRVDPNLKIRPHDKRTLICVAVKSSRIMRARRRNSGSGS